MTAAAPLPAVRLRQAGAKATTATAKAEQQLCPSLPRPGARNGLARQAPSASCAEHGRTVIVGSSGVPLVTSWARDGPRRLSKMRLGLVSSPKSSESAPRDKHCQRGAAEALAASSLWPCLTC